MKTTLLIGKPAFTLSLLFAFAASSVVPEAEAATSLVLTNVALLPNGGVQLQALGATGMVYSFQVSSNIQDWRTIDFANPESGGAAFADRSAAETSARFYRVRADMPNAQFSSTNYHGWSNSIVLSNGQVETAIVPAVGRVMQFRFVDQAEGPFWENIKLYGKQPAANSWDTAGSFGGDKVWPAPQSVWNWPPPRGFDSLSYTGSVAKGEVTLAGPVDSTFGTRVVRRISLHPVEPILRVSSTFEKRIGKTNQMSVWVVTQVKEAERVFVPVPAGSLFPNGYTALGTVPKGTVVTNGLVSLARDPSAGCKVGNDAGALLWVGTNSVLLVESPRVPGIPKNGYPDAGCSAEVYTNPNPTPYIELEMLGPLVRLGTNDTLEATSVYTLFRRTQATAREEAKRILGR
ncbi:MAG: hypothetical protein HY735_27290 [Verrucomicrobia bacterium]|nr:hypothetical protein [Verrucomicrobiota bacterium]